MSALYRDHFGFAQAPFRITPDAALFYQAPGHGQVLDWIETSVLGGAPILVLTGEVGSGKTMLLRHLLERHRRDWAIGLISTFGAEDGIPLQWARNAFALPDEGDSPAVLMGQLRDYAGISRQRGVHPVLIVDEAQNLRPIDIEALVSLTADDPRSGAGLTLLLVGQPELRELLTVPALRGVRTENGNLARLPLLTEPDTGAYVGHRLAAAGARDPIFDAGARRVLHDYGRGVPRRINIMADFCLLAAADEGRSHLDAAWVEEVLREATTTGALSHLGGPMHLDAGRRATAPVPAGPPTSPRAVARALLGRQPLPGETPQPRVEPGRVEPDRSDAAAAEAPMMPASRPAPTAAALPQPGPLTPGRSSPFAAPVRVPSAPPPREAAPLPAGSPAADTVPQAAAVPAAALMAAPQRPVYETAAPLPEAAPRGRPMRWGLPLMAAAAMAAAGAWVMLTTDPATDASAPAPAAGQPAPATAAAPAPVQTEPAPVRAVLTPVPVTAAPEPEALVREALARQAADPAQAAVAYGRAALRGRGRAAVYLGQFYETGLGVDENPAMARLWYAAAGEMASAQRRLDALPPATGAPGTPVPLFQARIEGGHSEMIWTMPPGTAPVRFRVETRAQPDTPLRAHETTVPGLILPNVVSAWRVTAIAADGTEGAPSPIVVMIAAE